MGVVVLVAAVNHFHTGQDLCAADTQVGPVLLWQVQVWDCSDSVTSSKQALWWQKGKGSLYSITERRVPEPIPVLGSQPAGDVSHKPGGRLPLLSARPAVTPTTFKRAATSFAAWWTEAHWVWTVWLRLLPDSVAAAIWTLLCLSPSR